MRKTRQTFYQHDGFKALMKQFRGQGLSGVCTPPSPGGLLSRVNQARTTHAW